MRTPQLFAFLGVGLLAGTIALEGFTRAGGLSAVTLAVLTGLGSTCFAVSLWQGRPIEDRRHVSLGAVFCLYYAVSYGFAVLGAPPPFAQRLLPNGLDSVNLIALPLGILAWLLGYRVLHLTALTRTARHLLVPRTTLRPVGPSTLLVFFATTVVVRLWLIVSGGGYGFLRDVVDATTSANPLVQYLVVYGEFGVVIVGLAIVASGHTGHNGPGYRRAYLWILPVEVILRLIAGNKSGLLLLALVVVLASATAGTVSRLPRKLTAAGLAGMLIVFPLVGTYRDILRPATGPQLSASEAPAAAVTAVKKTASTAAAGPLAYGRFAYDQTAGRFREIDRAAVSIQAHDAGKPYSAASEMPLRVASGMIPRLLWPDKPLNLYALDVSRDYYGLSTNVISASSLSPVGDAYRYGGLAMVAAALALLGAFVRFLDEMLAPRHSIWLVPLLIAAIPLIRGGDLAGLLVAAIRYYLIVGIFYRFLFVRASRTSTATGRLTHSPRNIVASGRQS